MHMDIAHGHCMLNPFSVGTDFKHPSLTCKVDPHTERVQYIIYNGRRHITSNEAERANQDIYDDLKFN